ncbi:hypothetical protein SAMN05216480_101132 [Pustulibacterium marinum]|uniref:O-Antigen ligase n=1 Tax=Pustulibacterium marinum TaxID=1224947 RepID=A0A1I7ETQ6_9FLAO|nr:hypothetical protein [Pustulibacterium marinum]SFU27301.1 hypothetical protein SAMN05216480_101132 [Pustulibacterium marinum]
MIDIYRKINSYKEFINSILIIFVFITLPFTIKIGNISIIVAAIFNILFFDKNNVRKLLSPIFLFPLALFVIQCISAFFSFNKELAIKALDLYLLSVLLPIIILNQNLKDCFFFDILKWFYNSVIVACLILLVHFLIKLLFNYNYTDLHFHGFTKILGQHPVYFSLFIVVAFLIDIYTGNFSSISKKKMVHVGILLTSLVLCSSKAVITIAFLIFLHQFFIHFNKFMNKKNLIFLLFFVFLFFLISPRLMNRFTDGLVIRHEVLNFKPTDDYYQKKQFSYQEKTTISDLELRYIFAKIALYNLFKKQKILFGFNEGDAQDVLDYNYMSYNLAPNWFEGFNVHNQYINYLFYYGFLGFFIFIFYLIYNTFVLFNGNVIYRYFCILVYFIFLFEVCLVRNKGITFFFLFNSLFLTKVVYFENSNNRDQRNP